VKAGARTDCSASDFMERDGSLIVASASTPSPSTVISGAPLFLPSNHNSNLSGAINANCFEVSYKAPSDTTSQR
jgi:hypothetical protein